MINLLIGPPGGGKSYEAVVYHVLPSLEEGRKVITNLPLDVAEFEKIIPGCGRLIELRPKARDPECTHAFGSVEDYGDDWRNEKGQGALYVIDEAHKPLPRRGLGDRAGRLVDEWFAEHRHEGCDVLLMTQSYGKLSKAITDQVQICYRVKKATAFGDSKSYIRKVQDGVRGDVLSTADREYQSKWFRLYKSHTRTVSAVQEADAKDVSPAFLKWKRAGYLVIGGAVLWLLVDLAGKFWSDEASEPVAAASARTKEHATGRPEGPHASQPNGAPVAVPGLPIPSSDRRLVGVIQAGAIGYAISYSPNFGETRIPLYLCNRQPFEGWVCNLDGELVTANTGEAPPKAGGGGLAERIIAPS